MHDPYTLVCDLRFLQIWHRDKGGHDGACGWSYPLLTESQLKDCRALGHIENRDRHFLRWAEKDHRGDLCEKLALYRAALMRVNDMLRIGASQEVIERMVMDGAQIGGRLNGMFCFLPGYHTNGDRDDAEEVWSRACAGMAKQLLRLTRPWYRHPRWHFWHWRIVIRLFGRNFGSTLP